jgi:hypothetical protein
MAHRRSRTPRDRMNATYVLRRYVMLGFEQERHMCHRTYSPSLPATQRSKAYHLLAHPLFPLTLCRLQVMIRAVRGWECGPLCAGEKRRRGGGGPRGAKRPQLDQPSAATGRRHAEICKDPWPFHIAYGPCICSGFASPGCHWREQSPWHMD